MPLNNDPPDWNRDEARALPAVQAGDAAEASARINEFLARIATSDPDRHSRVWRDVAGRLAELWSIEAVRADATCRSLIEDIVRSEEIETFSRLIDALGQEINRIAAAINTAPKAPPAPGRLRLTL